MVNPVLTPGMLGQAIGAEREAVLYAHKLERQVPTADAAHQVADDRWPRHRRVAFLAVAAALCWAVPILVAYLLATA
jgi:hypothetical protein